MGKDRAKVMELIKQYNIGMQFQRNIVLSTWFFAKQMTKTISVRQSRPFYQGFSSSN